MTCAPRILIVEDSPTMRSLLTSSLEELEGAVKIVEVASGLNPLAFDATYQSSLVKAQEFAVYLIHLYGASGTQINGMRFRIPNSDAAFATRILKRRISDRIALAETLTGLSTAKHFFINGVTIHADNRNHLQVEWLLAPADMTAYWQLDVAGSSEMGDTTVLGFV